MGSIENLGRVTLPPNMQIDGHDSMRLAQIKGHKFFKLSDTAEAAPAQETETAQRGAGAGGASAADYGSTVRSICQQIEASATSRSLLDRLRDPHNHTAKTQILQLVQLAAKEGPKGLAASSLRRLMVNADTRPLMASALASAKIGAPWVAKCNTKVASGVLNMDALATDANKVFAELGGSSPSSQWEDCLKQMVQKITSKLENHGRFENEQSQVSVSQGRSGSHEMAGTRDVFGNSDPSPRDRIAGQLVANSQASWDAMLQERPISVGNRVQITSWQDLQSQILDPIDGVHRTESEVKSAVAQLKGAENQREALRHLSAVGAQVDALQGAIEKLPARSLATEVWCELCERVETLGIKWTPPFSSDTRADSIESMQKQALDALKGMYRFIPCTERGQYCSNLDQRYGSIFPFGSIREQLDEVTGNIRANIGGIASGDWNPGLAPENASLITEFLEKAEALLNLTP
ncbi:MAG: hypothetical protein LBD54_00930 [Puniceicoccales bacterium]|jgi:hypothetical protein|nr:hypothetical protein [Puniceicoccales bacterium]